MVRNPGSNYNTGTFFSRILFLFEKIKRKFPTGILISYDRRNFFPKKITFGF
ncbi:hypothetical protein LSS_07889 [Leptospira santarosai serovar Shermani str. LT 821]|uniref:Uncharacterized protein n=1 Tax=Leptospira santarosai serovar Shermani str. LT 821 TaxID=758847 RepID=K8YCJ6_9LEPT|nr:hypothetical protein LSS_07889 [Leptospira santarosai serovar Shermani str. LT 821]